MFVRCLLLGISLVLKEKKKRQDAFAKKMKELEIK